LTNISQDGVSLEVFLQDVGGNVAFFFYLSGNEIQVGLKDTLKCT